MRILDHPLWPTLRPHVRVSGASSRGLNGPRHRLEIRPTAPSEVNAMVAHCPTCGGAVFPVRARRGSGGRRHGARFLSVACLLEVRVACARSPAARAEVDAIRRDIERWQATRHPYMN